jgi:hypothetical protein
MDVLRCIWFCAAIVLGALLLSHLLTQINP